MSEIRWQRVNDDGFEYAIQQGPHGDEFVKLLDGSCLRRGPFRVVQIDPAHNIHCGQAERVIVDDV